MESAIEKPKRRDNVPSLGEMRQEGKPSYHQGYIHCWLRVSGDRLLDPMCPEAGFDFSGIMRPVDAREMCKRWNNHEAIVRELERAEGRLMTFQAMVERGAENIPAQDDVLGPIRKLLVSLGR